MQQAKRRLCMFRRSRGGLSVASKAWRCVNHAVLGARHSTAKRVLFDFHFKVKSSLLVLAQPVHKILVTSFAICRKGMCGRNMDQQATKDTPWTVVPSTSCTANMAECRSLKVPSILEDPYDFQVFL